MSRSVAAMVAGYQNFEPQTRIAGVILNRVANQRHELKLKQAIRTYCHIPVFGALPRKNEMVIPDRHLGLVPKGEDERLAAAIEACRQAAENQIDLQALMDIARSAPALASEENTDGALPIGKAAPNSIVKIGVVRDRAFSFYYPENLEALEKAGAELVFLDAFSDRRLPELQALIIGGGFPEMFLDDLSANIEFMQAIAQKVETGLPVYAECAGLMYLSRQINYQGKTRKFAGVLPVEVVWEQRPQGHGYVLAEVTQENPFFPVGAVLRGHEFHHSTITNPQKDLPTAYTLKRGNGIYQQSDGYVYKNVLASYTHLHADGSPLWAEAIVLRARKYARERVL
jgi:cobyrinic acid a,c-diamide synthase